MDPSHTPRAAAFFDVDCTLLSINSGRAWFEYQRARGEISVWMSLRSVMWLALYRLSLLDYDTVTAKVLEPYRGVSASKVDGEVQAWYEAHIEAHVCARGKAAVERHRAAGHELVLLTSGSRFLNARVAAHLNIPHVLCTEVQVDDSGALTGDYERPACYGAGKVHWAEEFARRHGISLAHSHFYSDSFSDRPMLERVGHPYAINPDPRLKRFARARGWPIEDWSQS